MSAPPDLKYSELREYFTLMLKLLTDVHAELKPGETQERVAIVMHDITEALK